MFDLPGSDSVSQGDTHVAPWAPGTTSRKSKRRHFTPVTTSELDNGGGSEEGKEEVEEGTGGVSPFKTIPPT